MRLTILAAGALLLLAGGAAPVTGAATRGTGEQRPNVVVVMTDDQTVESLRVMANARRLVADEGTTFANSFASYALCCPSRATFLTGQYAHNHGVMGNAPPHGGYDKLEPSHANTLPGWLQQAGYHTVHIGKYLNGYTADDGVPPGWSEWYGSVDPSTYRFYGYTLNENGRLVTYGSDPASYQADVYTRKAVDAIRRRAPAGPFFLSVAYLAPHSGGPREADDPADLATPVPAPRHRDRLAAEPLPQPPSFNEADISDKPELVRRRPLLTPARIASITEMYRQRLESLLAVDEGVAQIVAALRETGELERTLIVFTADNGFFHGEHRVPSGKVLLYEPSIRVPLIVRGPGVARGRVASELVANIDLAPTITAATGARAGRRMDGRSLLALTAPAPASWGRDLLIESGPAQRGNAPTFTAIRTPRYVYAEHATGERELYDLERDPHELTSLHGDPAYAAVQAELAARLAALRGCSGSACARGPALELVLRSKHGRGSCRRFGVHALVRGDDVGKVGAVAFAVHGRVVARDAAAPFEATLARAGHGEAMLVRAHAALTDGRRAVLSARADACRTPKR